MRDASEGETALSATRANEETVTAEREHLITQRMSIENLLIDVEVTVSNAIRSRRIRNQMHERATPMQSVVAQASMQWTREWFSRQGANLIDWSRPADKILDGELVTTSPDLSFGASSTLGDVISALATSADVDGSAVLSAIAMLRLARQTWSGPNVFGEALGAEFHHVLRQSFGRRLLGTLALMASALAEIACTRAIFEGWLLALGDADQSEVDTAIIASSLARLSFESHKIGWRRWAENEAASMCQYVLSTRPGNRAALALAAGAILGGAPNLDYFLSTFSESYRCLLTARDENLSHAAARMLSISLFLHGERMQSPRAIPSLPTYPGGEVLLGALLDNRQGVLVQRASSEKLEFRPGRSIESVLATSVGNNDITLVMPITREFERDHVLAGSAARWDQGTHTLLSFTSSLETSRTQRRRFSS
jgi:hypothetical protein